MEPVPVDEVAFEPGVYLVKKPWAEQFRAGAPAPEPPVKPVDVDTTDVEVPPVAAPAPADAPVVRPSAPTLTKTLRLTGTVPAETWNRPGTKVIPKLKSGADVKVDVGFIVTVSVDLETSFRRELIQILEDVGVADSIRIETVG
jgi:hypothetical protein